MTWAISSALRICAADIFAASTASHFSASSPVGTAALSNSFTGMTDNYNASGLLVGVINGPANRDLASAKGSEEKRAA